MNTALPIAAPVARSRRASVLATASGLVAAASIIVALAVSGGDDSVTEPSAALSTATPDRATLYRREAEMPQSRLPTSGQRSADRFHHFR
jgi:hypothetical protein